MSILYKPLLPKQRKIKGAGQRQWSRQGGTDLGALVVPFMQTSHPLHKCSSQSCVLISLQQHTTLNLLKLNLSSPTNINFYISTSLRHLLFVFVFVLRLHEASSHDQIKMTKLWLEYDQKIFTPTNINIGTWTKKFTTANINH